MCGDYKDTLIDYNKEIRRSQRQCGDSSVKVPRFLRKIM